MNIFWNADGRLNITGIDAATAHEVVSCLDVADRWTWVDKRVREIRDQLADKLMRGVNGQGQTQDKGEAAQEEDRS